MSEKMLVAIPLHIYEGSVAAAQAPETPNGAAVVELAREIAEASCQSSAEGLCRGEGSSLPLGWCKDFFTLVNEYPGEKQPVLRQPALTEDELDGAAKLLNEAISRFGPRGSSQVIQMLRKTRDYGMTYKGGFGMSEADSSIRDLGSFAYPYQLLALAMVAHGVRPMIEGIQRTLLVDAKV